MKNDQIAKRIAEAPEPFRAELERLHKRGLLTNPVFRDQFIQAAARVRQETAEEWAMIQAEKNDVQKSPQESEHETREFPNKAKPNK